MTTLQQERKLAKTYIGYIEKLSPEVKLDIIKKLSEKLEKPTKKSDVKPDSYFFGAWKTDQTIEEMIEDLEDSNFYKRKIIDF